MNAGYTAGTAAAGSYPDGASPYGVLDMAGNVWEWTSSLYRPYPYDPGDGREDPAARGKVIEGREHRRESGRVAGPAIDHARADRDAISNRSKRGHGNHAVADQPLEGVGTARRLIREFNVGHCWAPVAGAAPAPLATAAPFAPAGVAAGAGAPMAGLAIVAAAAGAFVVGATAPGAFVVAAVPATGAFVVGVAPVAPAAPATGAPATGAPAAPAVPGVVVAVDANGSVLTAPAPVGVAGGVEVSGVSS